MFSFQLLILDYLDLGPKIIGAVMIVLWNLSQVIWYLRTHADKRNSLWVSVQKVCFRSILATFSGIHKGHTWDVQQREKQPLKHAHFNGPEITAFKMKCSRDLWALFPVLKVISQNTHNNDDESNFKKFKI